MLPGRCNIVICAILAKITFFLENIMAYYSAHFHEKFILRKSIIFVKFKKTNVVCAHEFPGLTKKGQESHMYHFLRNSYLISGARIFFSKYQTAYVSTLFPMLAYCAYTPIMGEGILGIVCQITLIVDCQMQALN